MTGLRVGVDALGLAIGGGRTWLLGLVPALARVWPEAELAVLARRSATPAWSELGNVRVHGVAVPRGASRMGHDWFGLPGWTLAEDLDVLLLASDAGPAACPRPMVQTVQNAMLYTEGGARYRRLRRAAQATAAAAFATVYSSSSLRDVAEPALAPRRGVVIRPGTTPPPEVDLPRPLPFPYVLVVSAPHERKDVATALDAVIALRRAGRPERLVLVGGGGHPDVVEDLRHRAAGDPEAFAYAGPLPPETLDAWYAHAAAFALPSREESLGFPLAEALARGVPSVASDIPALRETSGGAALHHAVGDVAGARAALYRALCDVATPAERRARGRAYADARTWDDAARRYRDVLEEAAAGEGA